MNIPSYYISLPHDLSGSQTKNRFRLELLWGVSKMLDLLKTDSRDFTMVFDYVCDIEIHYDDSLAFYQIKTHKRGNYSTKQLIDIKGEGSIIGKLYILTDDRNPDKVSLAVVSNVPYSAAPNNTSECCFSCLPDLDKNIIVDSLKKELGIISVDLSRVFYIYTHMDLQNPEDAVLGKMVHTFLDFMHHEPHNPNALYRLIKDTVSDKACYEYDSADYNELLHNKGIRKLELIDFFNKHDLESKKSFQCVYDFINTYIDCIQDRLKYKLAVPSVIELLSSSHPIKSLEKDIATFLSTNNTGDTINTINTLSLNFTSRFPPEINEIEKTLIYVVVIQRFEDGVYLQ